jgi:hypothetical protein
MLLLGPCTRSSSMVSMNFVTSKGSFKNAVQSLAKHKQFYIRPHHISVFEFFDEPKKQRENGKWQKSCFSTTPTGAN